LATKKSPTNNRDSRSLPPLLFATSNDAEQKTLAALKRSGRIRRIGPRLYTSVPPTKVRETVRSAWTSIVDQLFPGALLSHRSALEFAPSPEGELYLTSTTNRAVEYPGLRLKFVRGPAALEDDTRFLRLRASSPARALLENLSTKHRDDRALPIAKLEERLEKILHVEGEDGLNALRDLARGIADELGWKSQFERLDGLIGGLLSTRAGTMQSAVGRARVAGEPFDAPCLGRLQLLFAALREPTPDLVDPYRGVDHVRNKAFIEAYFSNYIEGTTFEIEEAESIVFDRKIPRERPKDAHDITGTFEIVGDADQMRRVPADFEAFLALLTHRHAVMMAQRPEVQPGVFKTSPNRAGQTQFVHPDYVRGTLKKGFELYRGLDPGIARAIFMMFLIADVHPFVDGNGRSARIMMNAEFVSAKKSTIIIPTVFREDYILSLRALSRRNRPQPLIAMAVKAQRFSTMNFASYPVALAEIQHRNWFAEPDEASLIE
jgi:hypothetical protein